jgi:hypothetical protein
MHLVRLIAIMAACAVSSGVWAQLRTIPKDAKVGEIRYLQDMFVAIDGVQQRLAPGAQIRDESNRIIVPSALPAKAPVRYRLNAEGTVRQVWLLSPEEAAKR